MKKQEMLLQPLENNGLIVPIDPKNPMHEKYSDLQINLISDYIEEEQLQLQKFLKKYQKPILTALKKYAIIGNARDFDQSQVESENISVINLHRMCSD